MDEVVAAARKANIHNFVESLPQVSLVVMTLRSGNHIVCLLEKKKLSSVNENFK